MSIITSSDIVANSRIDAELATAEASVITRIAADASTQVLNYIGRSEAELIAEFGAVPEPIRGAALALADWQYTQRGAVAPGQCTPAPYMLLAPLLPYRKL